MGWLKISSQSKRQNEKMKRKPCEWDIKEPTGSCRWKEPLALGWHRYEWVG